MTSPTLTSFHLVILNLSVKNNEFIGFFKGSDEEIIMLPGCQRFWKRFARS
jgi:hypothetical protein